MSCTNSTCRTPDATYSGAKGLCWNCYQRERRAKQPPKRVTACVSSRRYHAYGVDERCVHCGAVKVFAN